MGELQVRTRAAGHLPWTEWNVFPVNRAGRQTVPEGIADPGTAGTHERGV